MPESPELLDQNQTPAPSPAPAPVESTNGQPSGVSPPWGVTTKALVAFFTVVLLGIFFWRFNNLLQPIVVAVILAYLLLPAISFLERRLHWKRGWSVLFIYAVILIAWISFALSLGFLGLDQTNRLLRALPGLTESSVDTALVWLQSVAGRTFEVGRLTLTVPDIAAQIEAGQIEQQAFNWTRQLVGQGGPIVLSVAQNIFSSIGIGFIVLTTSIYIARDMPRFGRTISDLAHHSGYRDDADRLMAEFVRIWNAYLRGQVVLGLVIGTVVTVGLWLMGVRYALALGTLAGLLEFLPILGPVISALTSTIVAFFFGSTAMPDMNPLIVAGIVLAFMFVVQQIENAVLVPRIVGGALDLHPVATILAVMLGGSVAGILGAILAAPIAASIKLIGDYSWRKMFDLPPFPDEVAGEVIAGEAAGEMDSAG